MSQVHQTLKLVSTILFVIAATGCGASSAGNGHAATLARQIMQNGAKQFIASGNVSVASASCKPSGKQYACQMYYEVTQPAGKRVELEMNLPGSCSGAICTVNWVGGSTGRVVRQLGLDPGSPVAKCEQALQQLVLALGSPTYQQALQRQALACKHVRHGVYQP